MATYRVFKETTLPITLERNSIYLVADSVNPTRVNIYVTGALPMIVRHVITDAEVAALIAASQATAIQRSNHTGTQSMATIDGLITALGDKLDASAYVDRWKGKYTSEAALNIAHPTANDGDYAIVDPGTGVAARQYIWDAESGWEDCGEIKVGTTSDQLAEGSTNLFFTAVRVLSTVLTGLSVLTATPVLATDTILVAIGKLQAQVELRMLTSIYDTDADGVVDAAETIRFTARNSTGSTITKGSIVYINGAAGSRPTVALANASVREVAAGGVGVAVADILNNTDGLIVTNGTLHNLDTSAYAEGDKLWLSTTVPGGMMTTRPPAPDHSVFIGYVARSHVTQGRIIYRIVAGAHLEELHDVLIPTPATNDFLVYDATGLWKNKSAADVATLLGLGGAAGSQIGYAYTPSGASASVTASIIPLDATIPQNTEGTAYTSIDTTITPKAVSSLLEVEVVFPRVTCSTTANVTFALFRDSVVDAIAAANIAIESADREKPVILKTVVTASSIAATTFKIRWGTTAGTAYISRNGANTVTFGGVSGATMTVREIAQ